MAEEQDPLTGLGVHPHHRVLDLVIVGFEPLTVATLFRGDRAVGVVEPVGVHGPQVVGQRAQRRGQLLVGRFRRGPRGGAAVAGQRHRAQQRRLRDTVDERDIGVPAVGLVVARVDRQQLLGALGERRMGDGGRTQQLGELQLSGIVEMVWPEKKITLCSRRAALMALTVAGDRSPPTRTPSILAPMWAPSLVTVTCT